MKSRAYSSSMQGHVLRGEPAPLADSVSVLYVTLWNGDPGDSDSQTESIERSSREIPGIVRGPIARGPGSWKGDGQSLTNAVLVTIQAGRHDQPRTATHWQLGTSPTGDGLALMSGKLKQPQDIVGGMLLDFHPGNLRSDEF